MTTTEAARDRRHRGPAAPAQARTHRVWGDWRVGCAVTVALAATLGMVSGGLIPRGPVTAAQALITMTAATAVGGAAGVATGRRWSLVLAPVTFVAVFELVRMGAVGPTVDLPRSLTLIGLAPFVLGRGVHGLLAVVPMLLGGIYGVELAARRGAPGAPRLAVIGWATAGLLTVAVVWLAIAVARPASTAAILGPDGRPLPGSIAELVSVPIGGHDQALMIRGHSTDNPVLLHLAGGPGGSDIGAMRLDTALEQHFVVATWDQRGTGKSYPAFDAAALTLEQVVADTVAVTNHLRERFGQERIYLTGQSWGTIPAVLAAQRHPELYAAFVGTGQMVSIRATDSLFYDDTLAWARRTGRTDLEGQLVTLGPPPYAEPISTYPVLVGAERDLNPYPEFDGHTEMTATIWVPEYSFMDRVGALRGLADTYAVLYPQLQELDLRHDVLRLDVPIHLVMGRHEARGRVEPARQWFDALQAPAKTWAVFDGSSHRASFERPGDYARLLARVLADTGGTSNSTTTGPAPRADAGG